MTALRGLYSSNACNVERLLFVVQCRFVHAILCPYGCMDRRHGSDSNQAFLDGFLDRIRIKLSLMASLKMGVECEPPLEIADRVFL